MGHLSCWPCQLIAYSQAVGREWPCHLGSTSFRHLQLHAACSTVANIVLGGAIGAAEGKAISSCGLRLAAKRRDRNGRHAEALRRAPYRERTVDMQTVFVMWGGVLVAGPELTHTNVRRFRETLRSRVLVLVQSFRDPPYLPVAITFDYVARNR